MAFYWKNVLFRKGIWILDKPDARIHHQKITKEYPIPFDHIKFLIFGHHFNQSITLSSNNMPI